MTQISEVRHTCAHPIGTAFDSEFQKRLEYYGPMVSKSIVVKRAEKSSQIRWESGRRTLGLSSSGAL
jgi:hypothetical protein